MIRKEDVYIKPYKLNRTLHIYLPDNYEETKEKYPVMYMFDGHNLFFDEDATYGESWGLEDFMKEYDKQVIIVGIECNHEGSKRLEEFSPYTFNEQPLGHIIGTGQQLLNWLVSDLKPYIDKKYRTKKDRLNTAIGGSSMGGLMSIYTIIKFNDVFSKAACLSPAYYMVYDELLDDIKKSSLDKKTKIYYDFGSKEIDDLLDTTISMLEISNILNDKGVNVHARIAKGGKHNEATWKKSNPVYMDYLWK